MKNFIFIPVVNHLDLLEKAVRSVKPEIYNEYIIFNNTGDVLPKEIYKGTPFRVWQPPFAMSFMQTQNIMRAYAMDNKFDSYSFMHNDGEVLDDTDARLVAFAESQNKAKNKWGVIFTSYDVLCIFNTNAVREVGVWGDDNWPEQKSGYYLDNDYYRRIEQSEYQILYLENSNVSHEKSSNTIQDKKEKAIWDIQRQSVVDYYISKWGGEPGEETK